MIIDHFESLGDNCEFGFLQRALGSEEGSLFRWAFVTDFSDLINLINNDFVDFYQFENLVATSESMVLDRGTGLHFHTEMYSSRDPASGLWEFNDSLADRRKIYDSEISKVRYLVEKFRRSMKTEDRIFVIKINASAPLDHAGPLLAALSARGNAKLLVVAEADAQNPAGSAKVLADNLCAGYVSRFAAYHAADDICIESWTEALENAHALCLQRDEASESLD